MERFVYVLCLILFVATPMFFLLQRIGSESSESVESSLEEAKREAALREEQQLTVLKDNNGDKCVIRHHANGTETATYHDGRTVTFRRDEDGNLSFVSGTESLLAGIATGYLLSQGLSSMGGKYDDDRHAYVVPAVTASANRSATTEERNAVRANSVGKSGVVATPSIKSHSGFGSAGVRSAAS